MSNAKTWSTHGLPHDQARDASEGKLSDLNRAWALTHPPQSGVNLSVRYRKAEALTVGELQAGQLAGYRPTSAASGNAFVGVLVNLSGRLRCRYLWGGEFILEPGQLVVWESRTAHAFEVMEPHAQLYLVLPRDRTPKRLADVAAQPRGALSAGPGSGLLAIAADQLRAINRELDELSDAGLTVACQGLVDILDSALVFAPDLPSFNNSRLVEMQHYIEDNLHDSRLCASTIAAAQGISVRTLQQLFSDAGTTVSSWIRERRLKACYRELSGADRFATVTEVAFRWGFNDAAHFSRRFKQAFGVTPSSVLTDRQPQCAEGFIDPPEHRLHRATYQSSRLNSVRTDNRSLHTGRR
jgi:AraC-like DNA-binding protein